MHFQSRPYTQPCARKGPRCRGWTSSCRGAAEVGGHRGAEGAAPAAETSLGPVGLQLRARPKHTAGKDRSSRLLTAPQPALPYQHRLGAARLYSAPQDRRGRPLTASRRRGHAEAGLAAMLCEAEAPAPLSSTLPTTTAAALSRTERPAEASRSLTGLTAKP